jgi:Raf kinase inhibitor-like YbhB/YbcL family protein
MILLMETDAFEDGGIVPPRYGCFGDNVQPGFRLSNVPDGTVSFALILHDIDVALDGRVEDGSHWIVWNIPGRVRDIPEGALPEGSVVGENVEERNAYLGPGAPPGPRYHHYVFELYALNSWLEIPATADRAELLAALDGRNVGKAASVGRYRRAGVTVA